MYAEVDNNDPAITIIDDFTSNTYATNAVTPISNGSTAEWISERPQIDGVFTPLADFYQLTFQSATATQMGTAHVVGNLSHNYGVMFANDDSTVLADPGAIYNNGADFSNFFQQSGP